MNESLATNYDNAIPTVVALDKDHRLHSLSKYRCGDCDYQFNSNTMPHTFCISCASNNMTTDKIKVIPLDIVIGTCETCDSTIKVDDPLNLVTKSHEIHCPICATLTAIKEDP